MDGGKKGLPARRNSTCGYVKVGGQCGLRLACRCVGSGCSSLEGRLSRPSRVTFWLGLFLLAL